MGFVTYKMKSDNDSTFRAMAFGVTGNEEAFYTIKQAIITYMKKNLIAWRNLVNQSVTQEQ